MNLHITILYEICEMYFLQNKKLSGKKILKEINDFSSDKCEGIYCLI